MKITNTKAVKICQEMVSAINFLEHDYKLIVSKTIYRKIKRYNFLHKHNKFEPGIRIVKVK